MKEVKDRIKEGLRIRNMSAIELSRKSGISKSSISQYMSGFAVPKANRIYEIASALNVSPTWLLGYNVPIENIITLTDIKEIELISNYRSAPKNIKDAINSLLSL